MDKSFLCCRDNYFRCGHITLMKIEILPILRDNYCYFLIDEARKKCAVIDPGDAAPVLNFLDTNGLMLTHILNTHFHWDHTDGNVEVKKATGCTVIGPEKDKARIPAFDEGVRENDVFTLLDTDIHILETPGHTLGCISFYVPILKALFCGDVLFSMGCGRMFEGTPAMMFQSFQKIAALPDDTKIYCGHEYTLANGRFAKSVEPENEDIIARITDAKTLRKVGKPTLPVSLAIEKKTNPFLRVADAQSFGEIRNLKDSF